VTQLSFNPASDDSMELWDIVSKSAPHSLVVDGVVRVIDDDSHTFDLGPRQLARSGNKVVWKLPAMSPIRPTAASPASRRGVLYPSAPSRVLRARPQRHSLLSSPKANPLGLVGPGSQIDCLTPDRIVAGVKPSR
jgi:hypothetical protein